MVFRKLINTVQVHWKKSLFATGVLTYVGFNINEKLRTFNSMRRYSLQALEYGLETIPPFQSTRKITVILNPNANKRKAKALYEKYCAPLFNLAGIAVDVIETEGEGDGRAIVEKIGLVDAIVVAGGDGTFSEVITGLIRHCNNDLSRLQIPIGILPLGRSSKLGNYLFPKSADNEALSLAEASMAIISQHTKKIDVMKIEVMEESAGEVKPRPVYACSSIEWGAIRDVKEIKDKYWYFGPMRDYAAFVFNGSKVAPKCAALLYYTPPCPGCTKCAAVKQQKRWWERILYRNNENVNLITNPECNNYQEKDILSSNLSLKTNIGRNESSDISSLKVELLPEKMSYWEVLQHGLFKKEFVTDAIEARQIELQPLTPTTETNELSIDNESYDLKTIHITLIPKSLQVFSTNSSAPAKPVQSYREKTI